MIHIATVETRFAPAEFNRLFTDIAARGAWAHAWRSVRIGDAPMNACLWLEAWRLRHVNRDPMRFHITQRYLDHLSRKAART